MDLNRLTQKSQEALHDAQTKAPRHGHTEVDAEHLLLALLEQPDGLVPRLLDQAGVDADALRAAARGRARAAAAGHRPGRRTGQVYVTPAPRPAARRRRGARRKRLKDEYVSVEHLCSRCSTRARRPRPAACCAEHGVDARPVPRGAHRGARQPARDQRQSRGHLRGAREVRPRPRRRGARRQARPGDRPRRRDPPRRSRSCRARPRTTRC